LVRGVSAVARLQDVCGGSDYTFAGRLRARRSTYRTPAARDRQRRRRARVPRLPGLRAGWAQFPRERESRASASCLRSGLMGPGAAREPFGPTSLLTPRSRSEPSVLTRCWWSSDASVSAVLARTLARPEPAVPGSVASGPRTERVQHPRRPTRWTPENCFTLSCSEVFCYGGRGCRSWLSLRRFC
jgi:hypothetical protein